MECNKKGCEGELIKLITKMILYYFHERIWYKSNFGIKEEI